MKNMLRTIALSGSLALSPLAVGAQTYDTWTLNREVLNAAANYTGVLTTAHTQVRKYITRDWNTSLSEAEQQARTDDLAEITAGQKIDTERFPNIVPILNWDVLNSYDVRFRYCDNMLLSYFDGTDFKHGLSARQIIDAPVLRAQRAGRTFNRDQLGRLETVDDPTVDDPTVGGVMMLNTGSRNQTIPACMGTQFGGALADGTVAYMTSAVRKLGPREDLSQEDTETGPACPATHPVGNKTRTVERHYRFEDSIHLQDFPALRGAVAEKYGEWEADDSCYRIVNKQTTEPVPANCAVGIRGNISKERVKTVTGREWHSGREQLSTTYGEPRTVSNTCRYVPPLPPPPKPAGCTWTGSEKGWDACQNRLRESRNSGGGGGGRGGDSHDDGSSDVDGDGIGDYKDFDSRGWGGKSVSGGCGACNGPSGGVGRGGTSGGRDGGGSDGGSGGGRGGRGGRSGGGGCGCRGGPDR